MPAEAMRVELLSAGTLTEFVKLTKAYFQELDLVPEFYSLDQDLASPLTAYAPPRGSFWIARGGQGGQAWGMAGVLPIASRTCELKHLYVTPELRRKGWGRRLLTQALNFASQAGYFEMLLALRHDQTAALSLADRNGFKPCARFNANRQTGIFLSHKLTAPA